MRAMNWSLMIGGSILAGMGIVHFVWIIWDKLYPRWLTPANDAVRVTMQSTTVRASSGRATMWDAWVGYNLSHTTALLVFGAGAFSLGWHVAQPAIVMRWILVLISMIYVGLSLRFWFLAPTLGFIIATVCFVIALIQ